MYVVVLAVPPGRGVGEPVAGVGPVRSGVPRFPVGQQRHFPALQFVAIELVKLSATYILREHDKLARLWTKRTARHRLRQKRKLLPRTPRHLHMMKLHRIRKPRRDQYLPLLRMPAIENRRTKLEVSARVGLHLCRDRWNAIYDQIVGNLSDGRIS